MKIKILLGQVVLTMVGLWIILCGLLSVLDELGKLLGFSVMTMPKPPAAVTATLYILMLIGMVYSVYKLGKMIDAENGNEKDEPREERLS